MPHQGLQFEWKLNLTFHIKESKEIIPQLAVPCSILAVWLICSVVYNGEGC